MKLKWFIVTAALALAGCADSDSGNGSAQDDPDSSTAGGDIGTDGTDGTDTADAGTEDDTGGGGLACGESDVEVIEFGLVALDSEGLSETLHFDIGDCADGFAVVVTGPDSVHFLVHTLTGPQGTVFVTDEQTGSSNPMDQFMSPFPEQFNSPNRVVSAGGASAALVPNASGVEVTPGAYQMVIRGGTPTGGGFGASEITPYVGGVEVQILYKTWSSLDEGGTLPINLYFSGAGDVTAATAGDSLLFTRAVERLAEIYQQMGVTLGEVNYYDVDSSYRTITSIEGPSNDLSNMFRLSADKPEGLNYFFVDRFEVQGMPGGSIGGISGGVPGPPLHNGSPKSGVAVSVAAAGNNPDILAHIMAHEGGHFLGLFHVIEFIGAEDPLEDTPNNQSGGSTNLMYPAVGGGTSLTADQTSVVHHHPEVTR